MDGGSQGGGDLDHRWIRNKKSAPTAQSGPRRRRESSNLSLKISWKNGKIKQTVPPSPPGKKTAKRWKTRDGNRMDAVMSVFPVEGEETGEWRGIALKKGEKKASHFLEGSFPSK